MAEQYKLVQGSTQFNFHQSRNKVQIFSGGYANGKSTGLVIKVLGILRDYPGCHGLLARSTRTKLEETTKKVFFKWCPKDAIERMPTRDNPTLKLKNGSTLTFGYIRQEGKGGGGDTTSNVLSATYDFVAIDQVEDPEITYKDYMDMFGRLRGDTAYRGNDPNMPRVGPQWLLLACNPTRNWVFRKVVKPLILYTQSGIVTEDLLIDEDNKVLIDLFNGDTEENALNLTESFMKTLRASHKGAMGKRFIKGLWEAYEGLIYPDFDLAKHVVRHSEVERYFHGGIKEFYNPEMLEGFDYGISTPSCYILGYNDPYGNVVLCDGIYEPTKTITGTSKEIQKIRKHWGVPFERTIEGADPSIFKKSTNNKDVVGKSVSELFRECGVRMNRGNNNKVNGITKINSYLHVDNARRNVFTGGWGAPRLFVSDRLAFVIDEISDYYWKRSPTGEYEDEPVDRNDHAMDTIKYMMSRQPNIVGMKHLNSPKTPKYLMGWAEIDTSQDKPNIRHTA